MFNPIREFFLFIHRWVALAASLLVIATAGSGAILVFEKEMERILHPSASYVTKGGQALPLQTLADKVRAVYPKQRVLNYRIPPSDDISAIILLGDGTNVNVNQYTGEILGARKINQGFVYSIHQFHTRLLIPNTPKPVPRGQRPVPNKIGNQVVGWGTVVLFFLTLTGVVVWFPRMAWTFMLASGWRRLNLDLHNVTGIYALLLAMILAGTGIVLSFEWASNAVLSMANDPAPPDIPAVALEKGRAFVSPDVVVAAAEAAVPGAKVGFLAVPSPPKWTFFVGLKSPGDADPIQRGRAQAHPYTGEVLLVELPENTAAGARILRSMRPIHTGDIFGWPSRIVAFLASLAIVAQAITGFIAWAARTFKKKQSRAEEPAIAA